jgi:hypothetical protein
MDKVRLACAPNLSGIVEEIIDSFKDKTVSFELTIGDNCNVYYKEILTHLYQFLTKSPQKQSFLHINPI